MIPLDKQILVQYIDACAQVEDTKKEILKLKKARKRIEQDAVKGSSHEFPYTPQTFHIEGLAYPVVKDPDELDRLEEILKERLQTAERIKHDVEAWLNTIPQRMQRIIRYKIFEELTWSEVAVRMGRKATADGVRMEYTNFMKENKLFRIFHIFRFQNAIVYHEAKGIRPAAYVEPHQAAGESLLPPPWNVAQW